MTDKVEKAVKDMLTKAYEAGYTRGFTAAVSLSMDVSEEELYRRWKNDHHDPGRNPIKEKRKKNNL